MKMQPVVGLISVARNRRLFALWVLVPAFIAILLEDSGRAQASGQKWRHDGAGDTLTLQDFAKKHKLSREQMKDRFGAVGRIDCPWGVATAFLIGNSKVFMTSDHLFHDPAKKGKSRGKLGKCKLTFFFSKQTYWIEEKSMIHGFKTNKTAYKFDFFDWAVGRLKRPVKGVAPLQAGPTVFEEDTEITVVSQGMNDLVPRVCHGKITAILRVSTINEFSTDCSVAPGSSGGPILIGPPMLLHESPRSVIGLTFGLSNPYFEPIGASHRAVPTGDMFVMEALRKLLQEEGQ